GLDALFADEPEPDDEAAPAAEPEPEPEPEPARPAGAHADWSALAAEPEDLGTSPAQAWDSSTEYVVESGWDRYRGSRWFVPSLLMLLVLVLLLGAYGVGRLFAAGVGDAAPTAAETARATVPASAPGEKVPGATHHTAKATSGPTKKPTTSAPSTRPWHGRVTAVAPASASAACVAHPAVDAAGHRVTYQPHNAIDGRRDTTWRCPGSAIGRRLVVRLPHAVPVGAVGLVPGYAKTDPVSGADRYAQNNRITAARWILGHGVTVVQHLSGSAKDRSMRSIRVPRTTTDRIVLQVLAVRSGPFHTTCVSEVRVARAG
ncbi:MAG TPA: hypothetical protein VFL69_11095, partial [Marmoricola sp.]|nr:hypothetical protein [Marmoricola sp.]